MSAENSISDFVIIRAFKTEKPKKAIANKINAFLISPLPQKNNKNILWKTLEIFRMYLKKLKD